MPRPLAQRAYFVEARILFCLRLAFCSAIFTHDGDVGVLGVKRAY